MYAFSVMWNRACEFVCDFVEIYWIYLIYMWYILIVSILTKVCNKFVRELLVLIIHAIIKYLNVNFYNSKL